MRNYRIAVSSIVVLATANAGLAGSSVVFSDGDFDPADWTTHIFSINSGDGNGSTHLNGGDPGAYREHEVSVANAPAGERSISRVVSFRNDAVYDPAISGEVESINWEEGHRFFSGPTFPGAEVVIGVAVLQDEELYLAEAYVQQNPPDWTNHSGTFIQQNFHRFDPTNRVTGLDFKAKPDFSDKGSPFQIGFFRANATSLGGNGSSRVYGIDNWAVEIVAVCGLDGDVNNDGSVDLADLNLVLANFGQASEAGDTNGDGTVDLADLNAVLAAFGTVCP
ncbi:MAG: hypothetical protein ACF8MJ_06555 [Phycisphaerales bacterium JB050]